MNLSIQNHPQIPTCHRCNIDPRRAPLPLAWAPVQAVGRPVRAQGLAAAGPLPAWVVGEVVHFRVAASTLVVPGRRRIPGLFHRT
jgi:hypothetical protein